MAQSSARALLKMAASALEKGQAQETVNYCLQVLKLQPSNARALGTLGTVYEAAGQYGKAEEFLRRALIADPQSMENYIRLAEVLTAQDRGQEAINTAHMAAKVAPQQSKGHAELVKLLLRFNNAHVAQDYLESMLPMVRAHADLWQYYAITLKVNEQMEKADAEYEALLKAHRIPFAFRITYETYLPRLLTSREAIDTVRDNFAASLEKFIAEKQQIDLHKLTYQPLFNLAFHNKDNTKLARRFAQLLRALLPELAYVAPHAKTKPVYDPNKPIAVGFCSRHMHDHPVGRCYRNAMIALHKDPRFKVTLLTYVQEVDDKIRELQAMGLEIVSLPQHIVAVQKTIAERGLDILIYPDIGMNMASYCMAMTRLAPYQCSLTGHPDTTGIDTVDYFISSRLYEPEGAQKNYTEQLLVTPKLDTQFERPAPPQWKSRAELGLPADKKLYVCPMAIQKMHPDFDDILADILKRDPNGVLVLFNDFQLQSASALLQKRILAKCPAERVLFLDWQKLDTLLSIMKAADAVLATIHFGAGTTGQFATAYGIPMVNLPGDFARSRIVYASYVLMGIEDAPIATSPEHYAELAVRLANEPGYREKLSAQLLAKNALLFEDNHYGETLAQLLIDMMQQKLDAYRPA